jgi:cytochrome c peroxidase
MIPTLRSLVGLLLVLPVACGNDTAQETATRASVSAAVPLAPPVEASKAFNPRLLRRFVPLRARLEGSEHPATPAQVDLGRMLFFDKRLSKNRDIACNSCHRLDAYGVDGQATSTGDRGQHGVRNSPTVYNAAGFFVEFWDGRAANVEEQAKGPILNPVEMAMPSGEAVVHRLKAVAGYRDAFARAFPGEAEPVNYDAVGRALGAFERGLTTPSRWDRYLRGETAALTEPEVAGLKIFTNVGCMVCHTGEMLGGNSYQRLGAVEPWPNQGDIGRAAITKNPADRMFFKVPTLRNVAKTAPYFHDASATTLPQAVRMMGKHQLGLELADDEVSSVVAWLNSLTGELPLDYIREPELPLDPPGGAE